jgi:hypothetical protein
MKNFAPVQAPPVSEPFTGPEIARDLAAVQRWADAYWRSFGADEFFAPMGDAWSPAHNVRHLIKSNRPVARALDLPRVALLVRFGVTRRSSLGYSALRATYHEALAGGLRAGEYAPRPLPGDARRDEPARDDILVRWSETMTALRSCVSGWSERALGMLRLPHPGLGKLTVREMLFFTLYHNTHHVLGVDRRRGRGGSAPTSSP